ncbi:hypothetical protein EMIHUDRAFT_229467 [Emiliania huxleyi CCMP1516]|uniref:Uncharacterized protein n=2 Tax=Emiliania huxleyi TaxID=2903 RepID=A0A0D3KCS2_EMIH1|nr:hypothetical protein EMIHUDRAFT_229467 [Emiliania huxleyi CCMP1516]EOD33557.1 hypothetical protein EMIHUDRAFT_229467 [Emiliania huxleyi CCMP1516]|eukprot:XP_005785986.1 hypothetical protein EMIHUDRAFT_229467 [Emiliania huxleyi CCMP1516]
MHFNLNMRTKFRKLKQQYCMHKKLREEDCRFSFRAVPIEGEHTPAVLGMVPVRRGEAGEWWWEVSEPVLVEGALEPRLFVERREKTPEQNRLARNEETPKNA